MTDIQSYSIDQKILAARIIISRLKNELISIEALPMKHIDSIIEKHTLIPAIAVLQKTLYY